MRKTDNSMKIAVTGATGLLGSRLLFDLTSMGHKVLALKRASSNTDYVYQIFRHYSDEPDELFKLVEWCDIDLLDMDSVVESLEGVTYLFHLAAFVSFHPRDKKTMMLSNIKGTSNIVNACLELSNIKLCHVSSTSALGRAKENEKVTEDIIWSPEKYNSAYAISKFKSEMEVWRGIEEGLNAVIVNPSIILGPGFWKHGSSSMFQTINHGLRYYSNGITGFVSVKDVSECMIKLVTGDFTAGRFIISAENLSYLEVFRIIAEALNVTPPDKEATPLLGSLAWRLDALRSVITGKRVITRELIIAGANKTYFSNDKIKKAVNIDFENISQVLNYIACCYKAGKLKS